MVGQYVLIFLDMLKWKSSGNIRNADNIKNIAGHYTGATKIPILKALHEGVNVSSKGLAKWAIQCHICTFIDGAEISF